MIVKPSISLIECRGVAGPVTGSSDAARSDGYVFMQQCGFDVVVCRISAREDAMSKADIAFFDTKPYDQAMFNQANEEHNFAIKYLEVRLNADTAALANGYRTVCAFVNDVVDAEVASRLTDAGVGLVALRSAGYSNIDLDAVRDHLRVARVPEYSPAAVAEHTVGLMLCLNRRIHKAYNRAREHNFSIDGLMGFDFAGKTAGVIGTGSIGRHTIGILRGMGMMVLAYDIAPDDDFATRQGIEYVALDRLLAESDVILLHCPLTDDTRHLINNDTLGQMRRGVMVINTGRGALIDTSALITGLKSGHIGFAGLDVYEEESDYFFEDRSDEIITDEELVRLLTFPNVLVTSHQGFFTQEAMANIAETTLANIAAYLAGDELPNAVV